jgi:nicotinate-nucleotide adenylyltransferase
MRNSLSRPVPLRARPPLAFPGQRVGLMGGSFNPPHAAHLLVAETALKRLGLDQLWWMVTPGNPLKSRRDLAPLDTRLAASRKLARHPKIRVTGFEASPYTEDTVTSLRERYSGTRFVLVLGADSFAGLHRWHRWRALIHAVPIAVVDRPGWRLAALASPAGRALARLRLPEAAARRVAGHTPPVWVFLTNPLSPVSSTEIRGRSASQLAPSGHTRVDWPESNRLESS